VSGPRLVEDQKFICPGLRGLLDEKLMKNTDAVLLNIGDTIVKLHSSQERERLSPFNPKSAQGVFFDNFIYRGKRLPDIDVRIEIKDKLPIKRGAKLLFVSRHYLEDTEDWKFYRDRAGFIYEFLLSDEKKLIYVNRSFNKARAYMLARPGRGYGWHCGDFVFNFLQILLSLYWTKRREGLIIHGCGVKEGRGSGLIFAGESGCGKSTMAGIWHEHCRAAILNDDRVIVRRRGEGFVIFASPWHGDFCGYSARLPGPVKLRRIFFIRHSASNTMRPLNGPSGFKMLYPVIFPAFWDKDLLGRQLEFCSDLINRVPAGCLGFCKDKRVVAFIRDNL
jgi:hypothetical protein